MTEQQSDGTSPAEGVCTVFIAIPRSRLYNASINKTYNILQKAVAFVIGVVKCFSLGYFRQFLLNKLNK